MELSKPMSKDQRQPFSILELIKQLITDAVDWSNDEMALTRVDAKLLLRRYLIGLGLILTSFAILIAAVFTLAQTVIGALAEYLHGHIIAGLIVSLILFVITIILTAAARYFFTAKARPKGLVFRRIMGARPE
jgi:Putative Actinobacterial Holin-X, holin superfamily III